MVPARRASVCRRADHHPSRRMFLQGAGAAALGGFGRLFAAGHAATAAGQQKHVILVFMSGGPSQYETFDPKPDGPDRSTSIAGHVPTATPGVRFASHLPNLARLADRLAVVRSFRTNHAEPDGAHKQLMTAG